MVKELLPPENIIKMLQTRLSELKYTLAYKNKTKSDAPQGHLRIAQVSKKPQYYHCTKENPQKGKFIPRAQEALASQLAQKDYDLKIIKLLENEIHATERYLSQVTSSGTSAQHTTRLNKIEQTYAKMCPARQALITPVTLSDQQYAAAWQKTPHRGLPFKDESPEYYTQKGERVRSKSEVEIANALTLNNIPYNYESPLELQHKLPDGRTENVTVHPDFLCLNVHTRIEYYWEHFGLMDAPDYSKNAAGKLRLYTENGILPGRNLIITMETQTEPLSTRALEKLIDEFLK